MVAKINLRVSTAIEVFFEREVPQPYRLILALVVALLGICAIFVAYALTATYFPSITVVTAILVTIFSGSISGIIIAIGVALVADYFFIPPIGSILSDRAAIEHFLITAALAISMSAIVGALRNTIRKLIAARREAERASAQMEKILSTVSHDIRNSLGIAALAIDLMQPAIDKPHKLQSLIARASVGLDRTDRMIQELLDASERKPVSIEFECCDLGDVVQRAYEELSFRHEERFRFARPNPIMGVWNPTGIHRAIENLGLNAIRYGAEGKPITISLDHDTDHATISVHNEGKEIEEADRTKLFTAFFRGESAQGRAPKGWGLGLAIVKQIAEAHGGIVGVKSSNETGTTFTITIPIRTKPSRAA